jgi:hypothetical protein
MYIPKSKPAIAISLLADVIKEQNIKFTGQMVIINTLLKNPDLILMGIDNDKQVNNILSLWFERIEQWIMNNHNKM